MLGMKTDENEIQTNYIQFKVTCRAILLSCNGYWTYVSYIETCHSNPSLQGMIWGDESNYVICL